MKNIKVSDETHKELIEWVTHKEIKIIDIIDSLINTGLMTEKYGLSFFQTIIKKEGFVSKNELSNLESDLKKEFFDNGYDKGLKIGEENGYKKGYKESQELKDKFVRPKSKNNKEENIIIKEIVKEKIIEKEPSFENLLLYFGNKDLTHEEQRQVSDFIRMFRMKYEDIYGEEKNTRFVRLEQKRKK